MRDFIAKFDKSINGIIATFDRIIFKGHLNGFFPQGSFARYLSRRGVLLKNAGQFFESETMRLRKHIESLAAMKRRPIEYLTETSTHNSQCSKESRAKEIAKRDKITEGLVCILSAVEPCRSFDVKPNHKTHKLEVISRKRKCLHYYLYLIDPEFGWMHVRLQTWAPYSIQIYVNGREWLARQMDRAGIDYRRSENKILAVDNIDAVKSLCERFSHTEWPAFLERHATLFNPLLPDIKTTGFPGYWWVIDQCEYATDILFTDRMTLEAIEDDFMTASVTTLGATDVMRFLGRKPHHAFIGEVTIDNKKRPEGSRVRFRLKANALKFYDHVNVLRIETTINNPREFKILRSPVKGTDEKPRWCPMTKGVANFWRYAEVAHAANGRLLDTLSRISLNGEAKAELEALTQPGKSTTGSRISGFNPVASASVELFAAAMSGEFIINGFRNRDLQGKLYPASAKDAVEAKRRTHRISRLILKLRGHGLITKVKDSRLYRLTARGAKAMGAAIRFQRADFPIHYRDIQQALLAA